MIEIRTVREPFHDPRLAQAAALLLARADAMGLIPDDDRIETLDLSALRRVIRHVQRAGVGSATQMLYDPDVRLRVQETERLLDRLNRLSATLEECPAPEFEWERLETILGIKLLAQLLAKSEVSVRRYKTRSRATPDDVAGRLHLLSLIAGDLRGAYNDMGIRQWFRRKRTQLGGRAPAELLKGEWDPAGAGAAQVRELAKALTGSPAT